MPKNLLYQRIPAHHRKQNERSAAEYIEELGRMKMRTNQGRGLLFKTTQDMVRHMKYHWWDKEIPYKRNPENSNNKVIDGRTYHGLGIPKAEMVKFNNKSMFNAETQKWQCIVYKYQRDRYQRYQVFGHIAATHWYTSRILNTRWNIPLQDRYKP